METLKELIQENVFMIYCYRNGYYEQSLKDYTEETAACSEQILNAIEITLKTMRLTLNFDLNMMRNHIEDNYSVGESVPGYIMTVIEVSITLDTGVSLPNRVWG